MQTALRALVFVVVAMLTAACGGNGAASGGPSDGGSDDGGTGAARDATLPVDSGEADALPPANGDGAVSDGSSGEADAGDAQAPFQVTFDNFDDAGDEILRFDVEGNAIDAHDGGIYFFAGSYWLYGTSYDCGYLYRINSTFCGFKTYSSPDLLHWTDRGLIVPAQECQYCFRPHVLFNAASGQYVLWVNSGGAGGGFGGGAYTVFTGPAPAGPFTKVGSPTLNRPAAIDYNVFQDDDPAHTAYLIHNDTQSPLNSGGTADMVVETLSADYTTPVLDAGSYVELGLTDVEAPAVFKRGGIYYLTMSDPTCAYCASSTGYLTAPAMLGPWGGVWTESPPGLNQNGAAEATPDHRSILISGMPDQRRDTDSCQTQASHVVTLPLQGGETAYLFMGDQWNLRAPNESLATYFWGPLGFEADGGLAELGCPGTVTLALAQGAAGANVVPADLDQSSGASRFRPYCDIAGNVERVQTFVAGRTGVLAEVAVTTFVGGSAGAPAGVPDQAFVIDVVDGAALGGAALFSASVGVGSDAGAAIGWSPRNVIVAPNIAVTAGHAYGIRVHSTATTGCYGWAYNDGDPYAGGGESYSVDSGGTFTGESGRDLKFWTGVK